MTSPDVFDVVTDGARFGVALGNGIFAQIDRAGTPRHRADVAVTEINDLFCMGLPGGEYDIRVASGRLHGEGLATVGKCSPLMQSRILAAILREHEARRFEYKYRVSPGFAHIAAESSRMAPGTRRVGSQAH
jgi:hypothetical protein